MPISLVMMSISFITMPISLFLLLISFITMPITLVYPFISFRYTCMAGSLLWFIQLNVRLGAVARSFFRRAGASDALCRSDRRTSRSYTRGEAREGYAQVSFLGARCGFILKPRACPRPERYCAIARRLAARPKKNDEERGNAEEGVLASCL